jgi:hypothetical protein
MQRGFLGGGQHLEGDSVVKDRQDSQEEGDRAVVHMQRGYRSVALDKALAAKDGQEVFAVEDTVVEELPLGEEAVAPQADSKDWGFHKDRQRGKGLV